jgi:hypothetical protein
VRTSIKFIIFPLPHVLDTTAFGTDDCFSHTVLQKSYNATQRNF